MDIKLGSIKKIGLSAKFGREDSGFTQWLSSNLSELSNELDIELSLKSTEAYAGNYRCDILANTSSDKLVVIENQYGKTDHDHLGKLLLYLSALNADFGVWIAETFTEQHKNTLDWLNSNIVEDGPGFYAIEARLISIDESNPALTFNVLSSPPDSSIKEIRRQKYEGNPVYIQFYTELIKRYKKLVPDWHEVTPRKDNLLFFSAGKSGVHFYWNFSKDEFSVQLVFDAIGEPEKNKTRYNELMEWYHELIKEKGEPKLSALKWEVLENKIQSRVGISKRVENIDAFSDEERRELIEWGAKTMKEFYDVFAPFIRELK
ncbi:MAG: DUF4268 domain-containing protein [Candidatus Thermoplasmatota archaeon]|nr:DUF4268 domain-containing protein [Candidatus Thermoplasmatota archaeon]